MDFTQLRYFLIASDSPSFSTAAKRAFTSRQNLTRSIELLEKELNAALFIRSKTGIELSHQGRVAKEIVADILARTEELANLFAYPQDETLAKNTLNVAFSEFFWLDFPSHSLEAFSTLPVTLFEYEFARCHDFVVSGKVDLAFVTCVERDFDECSSTLVARTPLLALCSSSSALAEKAQIGMEDLEGHDVIFMPGSSEMFSEFVSAYGKYGFRKSRIRPIVSNLMMENEVRAHDAVSFVSSSYECISPHGLSLKPWGDSGLDLCCYALFKATPDKIKQIHEIIRAVHALIAPDNH